MYEKVEKCPVCKAKTFINHIICKDYSVSQESFALTKCTNCGFIFTNPRPDKSVIQNYYESEDYISHTDKGNNLTNTLYKTVRYFTLSSKLNILNKLSKRKTLLDYGCGTGDFLKYCQSNHWNVTGIEINTKALKIAREKVGATIFSDLKDIDKTEQFDIITLWHVLEHIHDLKKVFKKLKSKLSKSGHLIIALPNHESLDQQIYKEHWAAYDVPRHLYHFNKLTFNTLASKMDMKVVSVIPMKFDSFYVSLLSEKYKSGSQSYTKSFINGWKSNRWASKNGNNYSSLIYILKHK